MSLLKIKNIELSNFMGFGNDITRLDIEGLGPTFITGENRDCNRNNGAGKSSLVYSIVWCLFGRLPHVAAPGARVINRYVGSNCYVKIDTADGWTILRTRAVRGHDDLVITRNGEDFTRSTNKHTQKFMESTFNLDFDIFCSATFYGQFAKSILEASDVKRRPVFERAFGLNYLSEWAGAAKQLLARYDIKSHEIAEAIEQSKAEMDRLAEEYSTADRKRNDFETERVDKLRRLKSRIAEIESKLKTQNRAEVESFLHSWDLLSQIEGEIDKLEHRISLANNRTTEVKSITEQTIANRDRYCKRLSELKSINSREMLAKHDEYDKAQQTMFNHEKQVIEIQAQITIQKNKITEFQSESDEIRSNHDYKVCPKCRQSIDHDHIERLLGNNHTMIAQCEQIISTHQEKMDVVRTEISTLRKYTAPQISKQRLTELTEDIRTIGSEIDKCTNELDRYETELLTISETIRDDQSKTDEYRLECERHRPRLSKQECNDMLANIRSLETDLAAIKSELSQVEQAANPYDAQLETITAGRTRLEDRLKTLNQQADLTKDDYSHAGYIYHAYVDKDKIRAWILGKVLPIINDRLSYYLSTMETDISFKLEPSLNVRGKDGSFEYELMSGGERKSVDVAIMLAARDAQMALYGPQCNVLVLDEVDGRLDPVGLNGLIGLIINDLSARDDGLDAIFVISHTAEMRKNFPRTLTVVRENKISRLLQS